MNALLPRPKKNILKGKTTHFSNEWAITLNKDALFPLGELLQDKIKEICGFSVLVKCVKNQKEKCIHLEISDINELADKREEAYQLKIVDKKIIIRAKAISGIFYGIQTFSQILEKNRKLELCEIEDWPDFDIRGVHFMLQGSVPKLNWFLKAIEKLANYKINTILLEYEDKFPYQKHSQINHRLSFTEKEIHQIVDRAKKNHIQIIPLLQSLGHVEYVLKHEKYAYLRENKNNSFEYCPQHPDTFKLFKDLSDEIIDLHPESKYFHIGGDETWLLGECERCKRVAKSPQEKSKLYIDYMNKVSDYLVSKGKTPVIWSDVLIAFPHYLKELSKKIVIMYWDYQPTSDEQPLVKWKWQPYFGDEIKKYIPKDIYETYLPYWDKGNFPYSVCSLPYLKFFKDNGFEVIMAAAAKQKQSLLNIAQLSKEGFKNKSLGIMTTLWPLFPVGNAWYSFAATGEKGWSPSEDSHKNFKFQFCKNIFGIKENEEDILRLAFLLGIEGMVPENFSKVKESALKALEILKEIKEKVKNKLEVELLEISAREKLHLVEAKMLFSEVNELMKHINICERSSENLIAVTHQYPDNYQNLFSIENLKRILDSLENIDKDRREIIEEIKETFKEIAPLESISQYLEKYLEEERKIKEAIPIFIALLSLKKHENYSKIAEWQFLA